MKRLIGILSVWCIVCSIYAVPARRGGLVVTQPDGTEVTVYQHGNEYFHWQTNEEGEWIHLGEDGFYYKTEALSVEQIETKQMASPKRVAMAASPLNVAPRGLVILVNFADLAFETSKAEMDSMLTGLNYSRSYSYTYKTKTYNITSEGSARQYFYDSSHGQYNPQFDVVGPVTIENNMSYYGQNDSNGDDMYPDQMISEACKLADTEFDVDFTQYDNNNDSKVDFVFVIYAGYGEADGGASTTIWPHSWRLSAAGTRCQVDGKTVDLYACGNELDYYSKMHTGIGTFCHEFSHVLGLPDLYETNTKQLHNKKTFGMWSIMDYGPYNNDGNTPPTFSAYERFFLGWLQPRLIVDPENVVLNDLQHNNEALLISSTDQHNLIGNDPNPTTFYLVENRQQASWDEHLPGHGMMLTKIQYSYNKWYQNTVNNTSSKMGIDLIEADGKAPTYNQNGFDGKAGDLFPTGATKYTQIADHAIEEITETEGVIYFKYKGGVVDTIPEDTIPTMVEEIVIHGEIVDIYNILGQRISTKNIETLPEGTYIIRRKEGTQKIIVR